MIVIIVLLSTRALVIIAVQRMELIKGISSVGFYWVIVICTVFIYNIYNHILCFYKKIVV